MTKSIDAKKTAEKLLKETRKTYYNNFRVNELMINALAKHIENREFISNTLVMGIVRQFKCLA
jgi:hypothetical protein